MARRHAGAPIVDCPLCGPSPWRRWRRHAGFTIVRCRGCGLYVTWPRPSAAELSSHYESRGYYEERAMGTDAAEGWPERVRELLARVPGRVATAIDFGAGGGHAVAALRALGIAADGVEPSASARAAAHARHGLELAADLGRLERTGCDLVTFIHSLEHLADPVGVLRAAAVRLRPGGFVFIEVPHAGTVELLARRGREQVLDLPLHLYHFTPATLARVVERAGLAVLAVHLANPALLERFFAWRARAGTAPAPPPATRSGPDTAPPDAARPRRGLRRVWAETVLPWVRHRFPGHKFQLLARRPAGVPHPPDTHVERSD